MRDICTFLEIAPLTPKAGLRSNTGRHAMLPEVLKEQFRHAFFAQYAFILDRFKSATPARWHINFSPQGMG